MTLRRILGGLAALALASAATADPARTNGPPARLPEPEVRPDWLRRPTPDQMYGVAPASERAVRGGGSARIRCIVTVQGALRACFVVEETPPGLGFGVAALALAPQFLMRPAMTGGRLVESEVNFPIRWAPCEWCQVRTGGPTFLSGVRWMSAPTYAQMRGAFPERGRNPAVGGRTTLDCTMMATGAVRHCDPVNEEPRGLGFAAAARTLTQHFRTDPATTPVPNGRQFEGSHVLINFVFPAEAANAGAPAVMGRPTWVRLPTADQAMASYPRAALAARTTGVAIMSCTVGPGGDLTLCSVSSEQPQDQGFGAAAVSLAQYFRLSVWTDEGLPTVGSRVRVPVRYAVPATPTPAGAAQ